MGGASTGEAQPGRRRGGEIQVGRRAHAAKVRFPVSYMAPVCEGGKRG